MNLPNKITLTRIFLIPVFVLTFYLGLLNAWFFFVSGIVFLGAALTDALDGHIARSRNLVTNLGKFLDPIADKVLVSTALIVSVSLFCVPAMMIFGWWYLIVSCICVALILARELIIGGFRQVAAERDLVLAADMFGKIKTTVQDITVAFYLFALFGCGLAESGWEPVSYIALALLAISTLLTVLSGTHYIVKNRAVLKESKPDEDVQA